MSKASPPTNPLGLKSILGTEFLTESQIRAVLETAVHFNKLQDSGQQLPASLAGKTVVLLFFEMMASIAATTG